MIWSVTHHAVSRVMLVKSITIKEQTKAYKYSICSVIKVTFHISFSSRIQRYTSFWNESFAFEINVLDSSCKTDFCFFPEGLCDIVLSLQKFIECKTSKRHRFHFSALTSNAGKCQVLHSQSKFKYILPNRENLLWWNMEHLSRHSSIFILIFFGFELIWSNFDWKI